MKFGVREIVDVVFKAAADNQKIGTKIFKKYQPVFTIDTATTSSLEQSTTTVYAQGGKGYARLIAWEGEKQMTFTVTDALMSPMGLAVLTGAGLIKPEGDKLTHVHMTINKALNASGQANITLADLQEETGFATAESFQVCVKSDIQPFATRLDGSGAGIEWYQNVSWVDVESTDEYKQVDSTHPITVLVKDDNGNAVENATVQVDFYLAMNNKKAVTEIDIEPGSFGGYFYVEAQTLYRREDTGMDMAAEIILPRVKVQSNFTFTMAASGDPSTFDFVMDAFPGYLRFDKTKKLMCKIQVLGSDNDGADEVGHTHEHGPSPESPVFPKPDVPVTPSIDVSGSAAVGTSTIPASWPYNAEYQENQEKLNVAVNNDTIAVTVTGGIDSLNEWTSTDPGQATLGNKPWIALDIDTGLDDITKVSYNGSALTAQDVADAAAWGLGAGHFILWLRADDVHTGGKTFTLSGDDMDSVTVSITVDDAA
jgi:hypothetical protein